MRLIDADKFKENILSGLYVFCQENKEDIARAIDDEPTVERPQGEWKFVKHGYYECSECEHLSYEIKSNFCPNCGADMRGEEND